MLANKIWYQTAKATAFQKIFILLGIDTDQKLHTNNGKTVKAENVPQQ